MSKRKKVYKIKKEVFDRVNAEIFGFFLFFITLFLFFSLATNKMGVIGVFTQNILKGSFGIGGFIIASILLYISLDLIIRRKSIKSWVDGIIFFYYILLTLLWCSIAKYYDVNIHFYDYIKNAYLYGQALSNFGIFGAVLCYPFVKLFGYTGTIITSISMLVILTMILTQFSVRKLIVNRKKKEDNIFNKRQGRTNTKVQNDSLNLSTLDNSDDIIIHREEKKEKRKITKHETSDNMQNISITKDKNNDYDYKYPLIDFLRKPNNVIQIDKKEINENARKLEETLRNFGIDASVTEVSIGPTITRYEVQPGTGVKVSRIVNLADDIALSLAASAVRIEAPIPNKSAVGIEIPNREPKAVYLRELIEDQRFYLKSNKIPFAIGKDIAGNPVIADISKMPHLLIAGATGSGKSVCINSLIVSILYGCSPDMVKLLMVDPKVVELSLYNGIPHLLIPVVTEAKKAANALAWAVEEMTNRYKLFAASNVRDINGYNNVAYKNNTKPLPYIVVIIDELADLMMVAPAEVEDSICRLSQMARAAGMHLVIATQRPSVDVITGVIKANIPSRIAFAVSSQVDSRTIIDMAGAEKLLGRGDMLYLPMGVTKPIRVQGALVSEQEVEQVVNFLKSNYQAEYNQNVVQEIGKVKQFESDQQDELLIQAVKLVVEYQQASTSFLQRKLKIGYQRAARILDQMEERGIVSKMDSNKSRQVLITKEQFDEMLMNME